MKLSSTNIAQLASLTYDAIIQSVRAFERNSVVAPGLKSCTSQLSIATSENLSVVNIIYLLLQYSFSLSENLFLHLINGFHMLTHVINFSPYQI